MNSRCGEDGDTLQSVAVQWLCSRLVNKQHGSEPGEPVLTHFLLLVSFVGFRGTVSAGEDIVPV